ncbi:hypothetical protein SFRURICE_006567, partial [Spodoptera frugiperda]
MFVWFDLRVKQVRLLRGIWFDSWVEQSIAELFSVYGKFLSSRRPNKVSGSIPKSGKVLLGFFRLLEYFSIAARNLELCPVYGNRPQIVK